MTVRFDPEALQKRARDLGALNGIKLVFVSLESVATPSFAVLDVEFHNDNHLAPPPAVTDFRIGGGTRLRAGTGPGEVQVTEVSAGAAPRSLRLKVAPVGDYSTYTLSLRHPGFDPLFSDIEFKFRPGCFNLNCAPDWDPAPAPPEEPAIDYLARDYDSLRHVLITAMARRVPDWQPTSEADLDQVLIDLIAADADELADFQDRVMNEAYLPTARKRVSLARHARLMDYHIHEGNQASTWLAVKVASDNTLPEEFGVWTHDKWTDPGCVIFASERAQKCFRLLNELLIYDWGGTVTALEPGSTEADLTLGNMSQAQADALRDVFLLEDVGHLLIQQELNPETGTVNGREISARQIVRLLPLGGPQPRAESVPDPVAGRWTVRVRWVPEDRLQRRYCTVTRCPGHVVAGVSKFFGNLVRVTQGRPRVTTFRAPGAPLGVSDDTQFVGKDEAHHQPLSRQIGPAQVRWGTSLALPQAPLAFRRTAPGGDVPTRSTLRVKVSGFAHDWTEQSDLIESQGDDEHFVVATDERGASRLRFGDGVNGAALPDDAVVICRYRVGQGEIGNVGADTLVHSDGVGAVLTRTWNPFDVVDGRAAEPPAEILRRVPEAFRRRQKRAVTLSDYAARAEELPGVARARARYAWTGSWRTVRVVIDPAGSTVLHDDLRRRIADHLDAVRLIGEDLEVRPAQFVPLDIKLRLCAHSHFWPEDLRATLEIEFSAGYTPDGRHAFFHPDLWTFGQPLYASQVIGRALRVTGVERVLSLSMRRWNPGRGGGLVVVTLPPDALPQALVEKLDVGPFEIIQVDNDPSRLETGRILFDIVGGRR